MLRKYAGMAILAALVSWGCSDTAPSTSQVQSFGAPLSVPAASPAGALGFTPTGNVTMTITTTVDHENRITAGTATFSGNLAGFSGVSSVTSAHVNSGAVGVTGPVVIDLLIQPGQVNFDLNGSAPLSATVPISASVAQQILTNPAGFYFQVDSAAFPNGILRGQF